MNNPLYNQLSRKGQIVLNILMAGTALVIFWFYCLSTGPMMWVAELISDSEGRFYFSAAFMLSFLPFFIVEFAIVNLIDRRISRTANDVAETSTDGNPRTKGTALVLGFILFSVLALIFFGFQIVRENYERKPETYAYTLDLQKKAHIPAGVVVTRVDFLSKASRIGLLPGDIITRYNGDVVVDYRSYSAALEKNVAAGATQVTLAVVREGRPMELTAPSGLLGFNMDSWTSRRDEILGLVASNSFGDAARLYENAKAAGELSDYDELVCRISLIPSSDTGQDPQRLEMLRELLDMTDKANYGYVGGEIFYSNFQYKPAAFFFEHAVEADPDDIGSRANLGLTYSLSGRYEDAERVADQLLNEYRKHLSDFGLSVALKTKAFALEGRGDYSNASNYFRQAIEKIGNDDDLHLRMRYLFSLAKTKNIVRFEEAAAFCNRNPGDLFARRPYYVDSLRVYVLAANNQEAQAIQVVDKWRRKGDVQRSVGDYWSKVPNAMDVIDTWSRLLAKGQGERELGLEPFRANH